MTLNNKQLMAYGWLGAAAGVATGWLLKIISQLVSMIPGVSLDLQSISISTTGLGNTINTGLASFLQKALGKLNVPFTGSEWLWMAVGGALFVVLGAYVADMLGMLSGSKVAKLATIFVIAGIVSGWILSMSLSIPAMSAIVVMVVDAFILAWIWVAVDDAVDMKLVP